MVPAASPWNSCGARTMDFLWNEVPDVVGPRRVLVASDGREGESHLVVDPVF